MVNFPSSISGKAYSYFNHFFVDSIEPNFTVLWLAALFRIVVSSSPWHAEVFTDENIFLHLHNYLFTDDDLYGRIRIFSG
jgi:hypothetical protein